MSIGAVGHCTYFLSHQTGTQTGFGQIWNTAQLLSRVSEAAFTAQVTAALEMPWAHSRLDEDRISLLRLGGARRRLGMSFCHTKFALDAQGLSISSWREIVAGQIIALCE